MANTFTKIASVTVGSGGASSIDFTSIPATYTDLCVKVSVRTDKSGSYSGAFGMQFNADTGNNYSNRDLYGTGSSAGSATTSSSAGWFNEGAVDSAGNTANVFSVCDIYIPNYTSSNQKSFSSDFASEGNTTAGYPIMTAGIWTGTSAITSIKFITDSAYTWVQYSTAVLYGIKNS